MRSIGAVALAAIAALAATAGPSSAAEFGISTLLATGSNAIEHNAVTGDDRGGIAVSSTHVFYSGDSATGRFNLTNLLGGAGIGTVRDSLVSDLATGEVYVLANGATPLTSSGGTATTLLAVDGGTGALTGASIALSTPISLSFGTGIFSGWGRIILHNGTNAFDVALPSGTVTALGAMASFAHNGCENWAYWGVAEEVGTELWIAYVEGFQTIARRRVPDGQRRVVANFTSLSDMCSFTVSPPNNRWYFHFEGSSQFRSGDESIGFADATWSNSFPDGDGDGVTDPWDNCPGLANPGQEDTDGDGVGDACNDAEDADGDEWADTLDNCPMDPNPTQADADFDGLGDACDLCFGPGNSDVDGDGFCDPIDNCPDVPNPTQSDCDFDGEGDECDPDATDPDGDGVADPCDNCPAAANPDQRDLTADGVGDACDQGALDTDGCYRASDTIGPPDGSEPTFAFVDISASGTVVPIGSHQVSGAVPIGFDFDFYGDTFSQVFVSSNGFLTFLAGQGEGCCGGGTLPNPFSPNGLITGVWSHLHPFVGSVFRETLGAAPDRRFVLQFDAVPDFSTGDTQTWEIILHEGTNEILVQYVNAQTSAFVTAGIENAFGTSGLRWAGGGPGDVTLLNQAVRYAPAGGLTDDADGDGRVDCVDNCPGVANPGQEDTDANGLGDACNDAEDADGDEFADLLDNCPTVPNPTQDDADFDGFGDACDECLGFGTTDGDGDGVCDVTDNCPAVPNPGQRNCDFDSLGDACDPDATDPDADGVADPCDNCPAVANASQIDCDFDGLGDACDPDAADPDGDGVSDPCDNCAAVSNADQQDLTGDGAGDACDQGNLDTRGCYRASDTIGPPDGTEPTFSFVDISTTGTPINLGAFAASPPIALGFTFEFYGASYSQVFVHSAGFLSFLSGQGSGCCGGGPLPHPATPNGIITGLWDVLFPPPGEFFSQTLGAAPNRQFVVEFKGVRNFETNLNDTWEIILNEGTNEILVQYESAHASVGFGSTGGIENPAGTIGLRWAGPGPVTLVDQAVRYAPTSALTDDQDSDGIADCVDICPADPNPGQEDTDGNGVGDACNDAEDADGDDWADPLDNCPMDANPTQSDVDFDGIGDVCDLCFGFGGSDSDGDTVCDPNDNCPTDPNPTQADGDSDGIGDACDLCFGFGGSDVDGDGICDFGDNCPSDPNPGQADCDQDGAGDVCDPDTSDADGDGLADACDPCPQDAANACASLFGCTGGASALYRINPANGIAVRIGAMNVFGCGGLARHPTTGTLYAAARVPVNNQQALWTVDPTTGAATLVGPMGVSSFNSDLAFRSDGTLFSIHVIGADRLVGSVDVGTGAVAPLGPSGTAGNGDGLAFDLTDRLLHANNFTINRLDQGTGDAQPLVSLGFPAGCDSPAISALTARGPGSLLGILSCDFGSSARLVRVDPVTGAVTSLGPTQAGLEGIAAEPVCGDGVLASGEQCDDGNGDDGDCCSSTCEPAPDGTACADGLFCDGSETCTAGVCGGGMPPCPGGCDETIDSCLACPATARICRSAVKSILMLKNSDTDDRDKLIWRWRRGVATTPEELGDPTSTTSYVLCLYRAGGAALIGSAAIPADASRWSARGDKGFIYRDPDGAGAVRKAAVTAGGNGSSKALVIGKGAALPDVPLPLSPAIFPVVVQLATSDTAACWEGRYQTPADVILNQADFFKAKAR